MPCSVRNHGMAGVWVAVDRPVDPGDQEIRLQEPFAEPGDILLAAGEPVEAMRVVAVSGDGLTATVLRGQCQTSPKAINDTAMLRIVRGALK